MDLVPDLTSSDIIIPETDFSCEEANSCYVSQDPPATAHNCNFGQMASWNNCTKAATILRVKQTTPLPTNTKEIFFLEIYLVGKNRDAESVPQKWALHKDGVLGLAPKSQFWNYLRVKSINSNKKLA